MDILVVMAGDGKRFENCGYDTIKPLIKIQNKTILEWTTSSLPFIKHYGVSLVEEDYNLSFAIRTEHEEKFNLTEKLKEIYGSNIKIQYFESITRGNLETAYIAVNNLYPNSNEQLLILDADNHYNGTKFLSTKNNLSLLLKNNPFGSICVFAPKDNEPKWCFAKVDKKNKRVISLHEKEFIQGSLPMVGVFYFNKTSLFLELSKEILESNLKIKKEFYMSQCMQKMLEKNIPVYGLLVDNVVPMGTPEDVEKYKNDINLKLKNIPDVEDKRRICIDLDGTICYTKKEGEKYEDVLPLPGAIESLKQLKKDGWYIIIATARNMRTYNHNIGQVAAFQTKIVVDWLTKWEIPFDELWTKPHVSLFIDDKNVKFENWEQINRDIESFKKEENI